MEQVDKILARAVEKLEQRDPDAVALFSMLAHDHNIGEAWLALAVAHHIQADCTLAGEALAYCLSHYAHTKIPRTADAIVRSLGAAGCCALDAAGTLIVHVPTTQAHREGLTAHLDERELRMRVSSDGRSITARLPTGWQKAHEIRVTAGREALLGSPILVKHIVRVEGFVDTTDGDLHGWAWFPNDPDHDPILSVVPTDGGEGIKIVADNADNGIVIPSELARPRSFHVPAERLRRFRGSVVVLGPDGRNLLGSPIDPTAERRTAEAASRLVAQRFPAAGDAHADVSALSLAAVPAHIAGGPVSGGAKRRPVDVVIPVYNQPDLTHRCIETVLADLPKWARVIVVDDASFDTQLKQNLASLAAKNRITLLTQVSNRGFPGTANIGMRQDPTRDIVLLNSDTLPPPGWLKRLRDAAYSAPDIGTATPISNDATILSYPSVNDRNKIPDFAETRLLDKMAWKANRRQVVEIPTAVGFCAYIKRDCLDDTGLLREDVFAQGYGEENDFCIRARHLGWRHVAVPGVFVAHIGGQSFGLAKHFLIKRNLRHLNRLHPGYDRLIQDFCHQDPMAEPRRRIDLERWEGFRNSSRSVLLVTHGRGGGVQRHVADRARALRAEGLRPIVLWPTGNRTGDGCDCVLGNGPEGGTPNLRFSIPSEMDLLVRILQEDNPVRAEVHHLIGHDRRLLDLFRQLRIPYSLTVHDYSWLCPRINLVGISRRYCGEPELDECETCISAVGATIEESISPRELRERSAMEFAQASAVIVPSLEVSGRIRRYFPFVQPTVTNWEDDSALPSISPAPLSSDGILRICIVGAIGIEKGYDLVLACARDALHRGLKLRFQVVGYSSDDRSLLDTGIVSITGRYEEQDVISLIKEQGAQLAWLPSVWPETWCYTLSQAWNAGLRVAAFNIGTPADRIRKTGRGWTLPLGLPTRELNQHLLNFAINECMKDKIINEI